MFSADEERGYVYMPVTSPTSDMYGGHRLGHNLFGQSLVCVRADTGERVWHFQLTHHDLWDYDPPAAPILADITVGGRRINAVIQLTKQSFAYVFDRVTGTPVWPIVERPVPPSSTPGEIAAPTQPFPTRPAPYDRQGATIDNLIDFTPELREEAVAITKRYVIGPLFTPPSIRSDAPGGTRGTIQLPGSVGGADWQGGAFDPETGWLYVPSITTPFVADIVEGDPKRTNLQIHARHAAVDRGATRPAVVQAAVRTGHGDRSEHAAITAGWWRTATAPGITRRSSTSSCRRSATRAVRRRC